MKTSQVLFAKIGHNILEGIKNSCSYVHTVLVFIQTVNFNHNLYKNELKKTV